MIIEESIENINEVIENYLYKQNERFEIGLLSGDMGLSLFSYYYAKLKKKNDSTADEFLDRTLEMCASLVQIDTFCSGLAGVGFGIEHLNQYGFIESDTNVLLADIDEYLSTSLNNYLDRRDYDFLHASTGLGFYFLKRIVVNEKNSKWIKTIIYELKTNVHKGIRNEIKWRTNILDKDRGGYQQVYNISLSHGMSAIFNLLTKTYVTGILKEETSAMLIGIAEYILNQEINVKKYGSYFPSYSIESEERLHKSRLGWCYGDLGISTTLWQAGIALQNKQWQTKALEVLLYAAEKRRDLEKESVADAGLCHGTAGIAHIFYRMWWNTRLPEFKEAADYWFSETLKMARFDHGLAGYKAWHTEKYGGWKNEYGILDGIAGIGLALLSYTTETEPTWDECLLLS